MEKRFAFFQIKPWVVLMLLVMVFWPPVASWAFMDEDIEKPKPEFTRQGDIVTAKLIPRAKSTSVTIAFQIKGGGRLVDVKGVEIAKNMSSEINKKDFRSELFSVDVAGVTPGGEAILIVASPFFTKSTSYWIYNKNSPTQWMDASAENTRPQEGTQQFIIRIKDGGPFDSDGAVDGHITLIGGPRDSFWGYVMGTLFIRFFGVFIVLGVLMIGMLISGLIFQKIGKKRRSDDAPPIIPPAGQRLTDAMPSVKDPPEMVSQPEPDKITPELAAAIGTALAMHGAFQQKASMKDLNNTAHACAPEPNFWAMDGRRQIMSDRSMVFDRIKK